MAVKLNDVNVRVKCTCGEVCNVHIRDWEEKEPEPYETSESRMGDQICHRFEINDYACSKCHHEISAQIEVWEYPPGVKEFTGASANVDHKSADAAVEVVPE